MSDHPETGIINHVSLYFTETEAFRNPGESDSPALYASAVVDCGFGASVQLHFEAFEVFEDEESGEIRPASGAWLEEFEYVQDRCDDEPMLLEYRGRKFVMIATPHSK